MLLNLMEEQKKMGLSPNLCSIGEKNINEKQIETEAIKRGLTVEKFRMRNGPNLLGALKILRFALQERFDIMHSHGYKGNILLGFIPKKIRKIPLVSTLHGWISRDGFSKIGLYDWVDTKSLQFIDAVVLVNNVMLSNKKLKNTKGINLSVVYNGIPILHFDNHSQPDRLCITELTKRRPVCDSEIVRFCHQGFIIGSIGRLSKEKGFKYLLEAVYLLRKKGVDARLVIIGEGDERPNLLKLLEKFSISSFVLLPGYQESASKYLSLFDVFVMPSLTEGLPMTLLEAMQVKIPIVATNVGGIPEVLENGRGGLLVNPSDPEGLADAISSIYHDFKSAEEFTSFSYNKVITKHTSSNMSQEYYDFYKEVIKNHIK